MTRHGASHGAATLVSAIVAGLLVQEARKGMPALTRMLDQASRVLISRLGLTLSAEVVTTLLVATLLATTWGMAFAVITGQARQRDP